MDFMLLTMAGVAVIVGIVVLLGIYHPASGADILDWKPTRSEEDEIELELQDVDQMLEAQNERRRRDGRPEITEDMIREQVAEEQRELRRQREGQQ